ncbi:MAG: hypothetical protein E7576_05400 [Ruminococcaceae bacterium]|jgi:transglutaminase-like putative cysteine protease|nr:hypothetical protein [Oscillospiraceae bacterium]
MRTVRISLSRAQNQASGSRIFQGLSFIFTSNLIPEKFMKIVEYMETRRRIRRASPSLLPDAEEFFFLSDPPSDSVSGTVSPDARRYGEKAKLFGPRKLFSLVMAALLVLMLPALPVSAVSEFASYSPNRARIPAYDAVYDAMYDAIASGKGSLDLYDFRVSVDDFLDIYSDLFTTAPEFFFLSPRVVYHTTDGVFSQHVVDVYFNYDMNRDEREAASALYENELSYIVSLVPDHLSEAERALFVHDYLIANYAYDETETIYDAYRLFRTRTGVCQAYALAYSAILRELGMESALAVSPEMGHAWNVIRVDGEWYHVDLVYDDPQPDRTGRVLHDYFLLTDDQIRGKDHSSWECAVNCTSRTYAKNPLWAGVSSRMVPAGGSWYYIDSTARKVYRSSLSRAGREEVFSFGERWMYEEDSRRYWVGVFSGLSLYKGSLVLNTPDEVWLCDPETGESLPVLAPEGVIFGSNVYKGTLEYLVNDSPNLEGGETVSSARMDTIGASSATIPFTDVPPESIYYPAVKTVGELGLFLGVADDRFDTVSPFSRAMFVTVMGRFFGIDPAEWTDTAFRDVPADAWYAPYVSWAASNGIVEGLGDGRLDPSSSLTREQMYKITALCGGLLGIGRPVPAGADVLRLLPDRDSISEWAVEGTSWCRANGLYLGGETVGPQKVVTRGEAALLFAALAKLAGNS